MKNPKVPRIEGDFESLLILMVSRVKALVRERDEVKDTQSLKGKIEVGTEVPTPPPCSHPNLSTGALFKMHRREWGRVQT